MTSAIFEKILIATDFSPAAEHALALGTRLARQLGARALVFHAYDLPIPTLHPQAIALPDPYIDQCRGRASALLEQALEQVRAEGVEAESQLAEVPAASAIVDAAKEAGCDLIVIGAHGHRGLGGLLLGSVAERTVRSASCAVLTVRPEDG